MSHKVLVRDYIREKIGEKYLIPAYQIVDNANKIDFEALPDSFIIKANHGCGWNRIIKDKNKENIKEIIKTTNDWLSSNFYFAAREKHYKNIKPLLLIEQLIDDNPSDYKFFIFNDNIEFIQIHFDRYTGHQAKVFDKNWNELNFEYGYGSKNIEQVINKPEKLDEMKFIAKKLAQGFNFARVDLYLVNNNIYFGELTFTSGSGFAKFTPEEYDRYFGDKFKI